MNPHQEESSTATPVPVRPRRAPLRQMVNGVYPERIDFGPVLAEKTPSRLTYNTKKGKSSSTIENMLKQCTGMPVKPFPVQQHRCSVCQSKTFWYCAGCKRWLCMEKRVLKDKENDIPLFCHEVKGNEVNFQKLCFHDEHHDTWKRISSSSQNNDSNVVRFNPNTH